MQFTLEPQKALQYCIFENKNKNSPITPKHVKKYMTVKWKEIAFNIEPWGLTNMLNAFSSSEICKAEFWEDNSPLKFNQNKNFLAVFFTAVGSALVYVVTHRHAMKPKAGPVQQGTSKSTKKLALISIGLKKPNMKKIKRREEKRHQVWKR